MGIFPYFLVSPCVPDHLFFLALLLKLLILCCSCSCVVKKKIPSLFPCFLVFYPSLFIGFKVTLCMIFLACFFGVSCLMRRTRKTRMLECFPSMIKPVCLCCLFSFAIWCVSKKKHKKKRKKKQKMIKQVQMNSGNKKKKDMKHNNKTMN